MKNVKYFLLSFVIAMSLLMIGCSESEDISTKEETVIDATEETSKNKDENEEKQTEKTEVSNESVEFSLSDIPSFDNSPYVVINNNIPFFADSDYITDAFETYSELDNLGRCGVAYANICQEIMPTEKRGEIGSVKPTGWHTVKYDIVDGNYLYNRCHLIGYQLAGENANNKNLITGTRYMNVDGMLPFENMIADYVKETNHHVLYRVTPVFDGDNLVASGVLMEAYSVEDNGDGILFNVYCYNAQPGITIDYATGDSYENEKAGTAEVVEQEIEPTEEISSNIETETVSDTETYILNTNSKKFHRSGCDSVKQIKDVNKQEITTSRDEIISMGYEPCKKCNP